MTRCASALRARFLRPAAALSLAAALAVSAAGCGAGGGDETGTRDEQPVTTAADAVPTTTALVVSQPPANTAADAGTATGDASIGTDLAAIDAELTQLDAALKDFDQITATTEGDPSR